MRKKLNAINILQLYLLGLMLYEFGRDIFFRWYEGPVGIESPDDQEMYRIWTVLLTGLFLFLQAIYYFGYAEPPMAGGCTA